MKKIYSFIFASAFALVSINANAATVTIDLTNSSTFSPSVTTVFVGDVVQWNLIGGFHNVQSLSTPSGVPAFTSGSPGSTTGVIFSYTVTAAGAYAYECAVHGPSAGGSMAGGFSATVQIGIQESSLKSTSVAYPNPCTDKITIQSNGIKSIEVFNMLGEKVKSAELGSTQTKMDFDFSDLPSGTYFYRTYKEGIITETRKIVKAK